MIKRKSKGMSLIELSVVLIIIAIIATFSVGMFRGSNVEQKGREEVFTLLEKIEDARDLAYNSDNLIIVSFAGNQLTIDNKLVLDMKSARTVASPIIKLFGEDSEKLPVSITTFAFNSAGRVVDPNAPDTNVATSWVFCLNKDDTASTPDMAVAIYSYGNIRQIMRDTQGNWVLI